MIGKRLKRARTAAGLSLAELGKQVGVSANMIKKYEHDESCPASRLTGIFRRRCKFRATT